MMHRPKICLVSDIDLDIWMEGIIFVVRKVTIYIMTFLERIISGFVCSRVRGSLRCYRRVFSSWRAGTHRVSRVEDTCVRWRSVSWNFLRFRWNAAFMVRKIFVNCRRVCYVRCWVFAQPGNETRTTDSSLKCLAAALHLRPMMSNFGAMRRLLSERRNGWVLLDWVSGS